MFGRFIAFSSGGAAAGGFLNLWLMNERSLTKEGCCSFSSTMHTYKKRFKVVICGPNWKTSFSLNEIINIMKKEKNVDDASDCAFRVNYGLSFTHLL